MIENDLGIQRLTIHPVLVISEDLMGLVLSRAFKDKNKFILVYLLALRICFISI